MTDVWILGASDGELTVRTGVTGRAARMGHHLTIAWTRWRATVSWADAKPVTAELAVQVDSFQVLRGVGGVKGLSVPEKHLVRSHALRSLDASRYPEIRFAAEVVDKTDDGYRLTGILHIKGAAREHVIDLRTEEFGDSWGMSAESRIHQSDYGVRPYSMLMGSMRVADEVAVSFAAARAKDG